MLNPDMPTQELRLHMGEMTEQEVRTARAAIRWANSRRGKPDASELVEAMERIRECLKNDEPACMAEYIAVEALERWQEKGGE